MNNIKNKTAKTEKRGDKRKERKQCRKKEMEDIRSNEWEQWGVKEKEQDKEFRAEIINFKLYKRFMNMQNY